MNSIVHLLDSICQIAATYKKIEATRGEKYNIFRVIDMTSNETSVHSAFLADLLNPNGLHQMGDVFLKLFINRFFADTCFFQISLQSIPGLFRHFLRYNDFHLRRCSFKCLASDFLKRSGLDRDILQVFVT